MALTWEDYTVFGITLLISAALGVYYRFTGNKQKTNVEYLLGDRNQKCIPVALSLFASAMSAISMFGGAAEAYQFGTLFFVINVGYMIGTTLTIIFFLPVFFKIGSTSVYEYLEMRFGVLTRTLCSLAYSIQMTVYMGVVLVAPAIALEAVMEIDQLTSILLVGLVCTFYSTIGGIKGVIATDVFQAILMYAAMLAVIVSAIRSTGSLGKIFEIAEKHGRINLNEFRFDPTIRHTWLCVIIGGIINNISNSVNQTNVQRYLTMGSLRTATWSVALSSLLTSALSICICISGFCILSKYYNCDPIITGRITKRDQLLTVYVVDEFKNIAGITGLFVAGVFSASLSTISGTVNSLAAVTLEDYIKPLRRLYSKKGDSDMGKSSFISKLLVLIYGFVSIGVALMARKFGSVLEASLVIFGVVGGPLLGVFTLGISIPLANERGTLSGFICGILVTSWISFVGKSTVVPLPVSIDGCSNSNTSFINTFTYPVAQTIEYPFINRISYMYYGVIGFIITFVIGILISLCSISKNLTINPDLFTPFVSSIIKKKHENMLNLVPFEQNVVTVTNGVNKESSLS